MRISDIEGDFANLNFKMNDESVLHLSGIPFGDPKRSKFWMILSVEGGPCDQAREDGLLAPK
jgi:hypothetical protein